MFKPSNINQQWALRPLLVLIIFVIIKSNSFSQQQYNLVPNYSFENYTICPDTFNAPPPLPWYIPTFNNSYGTYLNACSTIGGVPANLFGFPSFQYSHTGDAYIGLDMLNSPSGVDSRTYVQTKLKDSLKSNHYYYTEFYANRTNCARFACNNISMAITKSHIWADTTNLQTSLHVINANAQVYNYGNPIITDTLNWVKVSAVYKAQGGEQYITLGNFKKHTQTNYITANPTNPSFQTSYYFDDISIIPLDSFNLNADAGRDTAIHIGDSAFIGSLTNGLDSIKWQILNTNGTIDSIRPGFWVHPLVNTCYVVTQTVNGYTSSDTVCVTVQPLPLKFISFTTTPAPPKEGNVKLDWVTANEINVSHFYIQRSTNGKDFTIIGKEKAENKTLNNYSFVDEEPNEGVNYYKIVSVDKDGKTLFSEVRELIINHSPLNTISVYPNPAKSSVKVNCETARRIDILNVQGQCLISKNVFTSNNIVETGGLTKGIYLVRITTNNGKMVSSKLIVE